MVLIDLIHIRDFSVACIILTVDTKISGALQEAAMNLEKAITKDTLSRKTSARPTVNELEAVNILKGIDQLHIHLI